MVKYDDVQSLSKKLTSFFFNMSTPTLLIMIIVVALFALLMSAVNESVITAQSVMIILIASTSVYIFLKKKYSKKLKNLKIKNKILKQNSILDDICSNKKNKNTDLCNKYYTSKKMFYTISNKLLEKYNIVY